MGRKKILHYDNAPKQVKRKAVDLSKAMHDKGDDSDSAEDDVHKYARTRHSDVLSKYAQDQKRADKADDLNEDSGDEALMVGLAGEDTSSSSDEDSSSNDDNTEGVGKVGADGVWYDPEEQQAKFESEMAQSKKDEEAMTNAWGVSHKANVDTFYGADTVDKGDDIELAEEEEKESLRLQRARASRLSEADFDEAILDDLVQDPDQAKKLKKSKKKKKKKKTGSDAALLSQLDNELDAIELGLHDVDVEHVDKTGKQLTEQQQLDIVLSDSPEVFGVLEELRTKLAVVRTSIAPLLQKSAASQTGNGISFLQVKNMLLLSYCTNLCFFLLLKSEGKPVQDHPVVLQLARFRTILDKMRPVEKKIRYQVNKLLSDQANKADDLSYKPDVSAMDVEDEASSGDDSAEDNAQSQFGADATGVYKVNKQASFDTFEKESMLAKRKLEREKEKLRANPWVQHMRDEIYGDKPEVVDAFGVGNKDDEDSEDVERRNYEESNYMRLTETKKDKKRKAAKKQKSSMADFDDFGDLEAFTHRQERVTDERRADQGHGGFTMDLDGYGGNDEQDRKNAKRKRKEMSQADQDEGMDFYREMAAKASDKRIQKKAKYVKPQSLLEEQDPFAIDQGDRRKITTKMDKNRGLMRYRNSDIKTSRMRYRKQYEKALTKRRREVSEFKGAPDKYSGEKSGLKPTTIKSTKL